MPKSPKPGTIAYTADKHYYYERAVQCVESEVDMVQNTYQQIKGKPARILREDFCGTANTSCEWIKRHPENQAIGLDIDEEVLQWGKAHNITKLSQNQQKRIDIINHNVLNYHEKPADIIIAMNFSYQLLKTREQLRSYFANAREGLAEKGILFIDAYGGHDSWKETREKIKHEEFTYYWHQKKFDPISHHMTCHIHFKFKDGSWLKKAFRYDWRMWTLPELQEILTESGFKNVTVYWEQTDEETGEGSGEYLPAKNGQADPGWIVYLSGEK